MDRRRTYRREQRLGTADISAALTHGRRLRGRALVVQVRNNGLTHARLGLIVPKRHLPRAVDRNRVKRVLREWFRLRQEHLRGRDLVVRVAQPLTEVALALEEMDRWFPQTACTEER